MDKQTRDVLKQAGLKKITDKNGSVLNSNGKPMKGIAGGGFAPGGSEQRYNDLTNNAAANIKAAMSYCGYTRVDSSELNGMIWKILKFTKGQDVLVFNLQKIGDGEQFTAWWVLNK